MGFRLSLEELSSIWELQRGSGMDVIHLALIDAAAEFSDEQISHLFSLIHKVNLLRHLTKQTGSGYSKNIPLLAVLLLLSF